MDCELFRHNEMDGQYMLITWLWFINVVAEAILQVTPPQKKKKKKKIP